ncbi:DUF1648 domain-containing protein [Microbacterium sp. gxy059]|uniref:DUF1648 domain-containing protein n=1 Tax=Microbacterium sp. gxy059 TaxID=2957199 RepID=UPI003D974F8F
MTPSDPAPRHVNHVHAGRDRFTSIRWVPPARRGGLIVAAVLSVALVVRFPFLPATIPTHFDLLGRADGFGPRWVALLLGAVLLAVIVGVAWLSRRTDLHNNAPRVEEDEAEEFHRRSERMMVRILLFLVGLDAILVLGSFGVPATVLALPLLAVMVVWALIDTLRVAGTT